MSLRISKNELLQLVGGRSVSGDEKLVASGCEFDSRQIRGGELFIALKGEQSDGNNFVAQAFANGAALAVVSSESAAATSGHPESCIVVEDTLLAFQKLGSWWRSQFAFPILAITGSVGKTTTKEIAAALLSTVGPGAYSQKSFNNHVGVPYSLCKLSPQHLWGVFELGMNHAGEIAALTKLVRPTVGVITLIAPAHIENLGSIQAIADAKCELAANMESGATLVVNGDDSQMMAALARVANIDQLKVKKFCVTDTLAAKESCLVNSCDLIVSNRRADGVDGISFTLSQAESGVIKAETEVNVPVLGIHNAVNIAAAALGCQEMFSTLTLDEIAAALSRFIAPLMRLMRVPLADGRIVIDDSYNANPASMRAALEIAKSLKAAELKVALLLGDMRELGEHSTKYHRELVAQAVNIAPEFILGVGLEFTAALKNHPSAAIRYITAATPEEAGLAAANEQFDILFVKASRGIGLDRAVVALQKIVSEKVSNSKSK